MVNNKYHNYTWNNLVDNVVYKYPEWDAKAKEYNTSISLSKYVLLKKPGKTKEKIKSLERTSQK